MQSKYAWILNQSTLSKHAFAHLAGLLKFWVVVSGCKLSLIYLFYHAYNFTQTRYV